MALYLPMDMADASLVVLTSLSPPGGATGLKIAENSFQNLLPIDGIELEQSVPSSRHQEVP